MRGDAHTGMGGDLHVDVDVVGGGARDFVKRMRPHVTRNSNSRKQYTPALVESMIVAGQ